MRHIPEEELHAYLDQALSRAQCVEIESHLAECTGCRAERDAIAALRDRTTALLTSLGPRRRQLAPPPFEELERRHAAAAALRHRRVQSALWAASLLAAIGLGWAASTFAHHGASLDGGTPATQVAHSTATPAPVRAAHPDTAAAPSAGAEATQQRVASSDRSRQPAVTEVSHQSRSGHAATESRPQPAAAPELTPLAAAPAEPSLARVSSSSMGPEPQTDLPGMWRTVSWDNARAETGEAVPHIDGLPVMQVQVQGTRAGDKPVMVVAQQLKSGQVIRTIEGPATDVSTLLSVGGGPVGGAPAAGSAPHGSGTMAMRRGDRMLAIDGPLPSDSLRAMIRRINAELRTDH